LKTTRLFVTGGVTRGQWGRNAPCAESLGVQNSLNNVASTFFNTVHLLQKDFRFEHVGTILVSFPGRHLSSVRPCLSLQHLIRS